MLHAYALPRRVRADGVVGKLLEPSHGLAPGCPATTFWLALAVLCWKAPVLALGITVIARGYVDDTVAAVLAGTDDPQEQVSKLLAIWRVTQRWESATTWVLNRLKSNRFATSAVLRRLLRDLEGPPVTDGFLDLGVAQTSVNRQQPKLLSKRVNGAIEHLLRISRCSSPCTNGPW